MDAFLLEVDVEFVVDDDDCDDDAAEESSLRMRERLSGFRLFIADFTSGFCFALTCTGLGTSKNTGCASGGAILPELASLAFPAFRETLRRLRRFMS